MKNLYNGKWAGLSAKTISKMLGISYYKTKILLKLREEDLSRTITLEDIGELIYNVRNGSTITYDRYFVNL